MKLALRLIAGVAATVLTASAAMAADLIIIPPPAPPPAPAPAPVMASPFEGVYFGAYTYRIINGPPFNAFGGQVGYNMVNGNFLVGGEARVGIVPGGPGVHFDVGARAGFVLGSNLALYAGVAVGSVPNAGPFRYLSFGGGAEFVIGNNIGIFGEFRRVNQLGGGATFNMIAVGLNFHP